MLITTDYHFGRPPDTVDSIEPISNGKRKFEKIIVWRQKAKSCGRVQTFLRTHSVAPMHTEHAQSTLPLRHRFETNPRQLIGSRRRLFDTPCLKFGDNPISQKAGSGPQLLQLLILNGKLRPRRALIARYENKLWAIFNAQHSGGRAFEPISRIPTSDWLTPSLDPVRSMSIHRRLSAASGSSPGKANFPNPRNTK